MSEVSPDEPLGQPFECSLRQVMEQAKQGTLSLPLANSLLRAAIEYMLAREGEIILDFYPTFETPWPLSPGYPYVLKGWVLDMHTALRGARRGLLPEELRCNTLVWRAVEWIQAWYGDEVLDQLKIAPAVMEIPRD